MTHPSAKGRDAEDCHHDSLPQGSLTWPEGRAGSFRVKPEAEFGGGAGVSAGVRAFPGRFSWGPPVLAPPGHPRGSGSPPHPRFPATASSSLFLSLCQSLPGHAVARLSVFLRTDVTMSSFCLRPPTVCSCVLGPGEQTLPAPGGPRHPGHVTHFPFAPRTLAGGA